MAIPFHRELRIGAYILKQKLAGRKRYPLVLMLEPLFRCNLACTGCGKIDYPDAILNRRLSVKECLDAADECGAPMVAIPGGEPLIHKEIGEIVKGLVARKKYVSLCTNALLLEKKLDLFEPSEFLFFSVHLDGIKEHHDKSVCMEGGFERAVSAIKAAKARGFAVNVNATIFDGHPAEDIAAFLDLTRELDVGVTISPGYARPIRSTSSIAVRPRNCSAASSRSARTKVGSSSIPACSWISWPATRPIIARRGECPRAIFLAGRSLATSWARATPRLSRN
jgi:hopanoid biosynthesis associated radical SAM protein HpnH